MQVVLLPGLDGRAWLRESFVRAAPAGVDVLVIDLPTDAITTYDELVAFVVPRLPAGPFMLVGESMSGPAAIRIAAVDSRITEVVLCASFVVSPAPRWLCNLVLHVSGLPIAISMLVRIPPVRRLLVRWMLGSHARLEQVEGMERAIEEVSAPVMAGRLRMIFSVSEASTLASLHVPVVDLRGDADRVTGTKDRARVLHADRDAVPRDIDGSHALLITAPKEVWRVIVDLQAP